MVIRVSRSGYVTANNFIPLPTSVSL